MTKKQPKNALKRHVHPMNTALSIGAGRGSILRRVVDDLCSSLTFRRQHEIPPNSKANVSVCVMCAQLVCVCVCVPV